MAPPLSQAKAKLAAPPEPRLARLIAEHFGFVWRFLRRIGVPEVEADDAAQQVFIAVSQRIGDIRTGSERAFLFSTALHFASRARRSRAPKPEPGGKTETELGAPLSLEDLADRPRARELLDTLLEELPLELRVVFVLYEIEQLSSPEIAKVVGVPLAVVATRLRRAREEFSALVDAHCHLGQKSDV